ncbi:hypothetical protein GWK47_054097 [Chionoecetes opilio]|uniref:Uncharacterized protein n=1 Tax=Chionoecetes opilio TaxID=41210 RepID=A0A8J4XZ29_CHIOP|nr:hypothetical protein GWK47_054097 [Chionoecetes opilio]
MERLGEAQPRTQRPVRPGQRKWLRWRDFKAFDHHSLSKAGHTPREDEPQPSTGIPGNRRDEKGPTEGTGRGEEQKMVASGPKRHRAALGLTIDPLEKKGKTVRGKGTRRNTKRPQNPHLHRHTHCPDPQLTRGRPGTTKPPPPAYGRAGRGVGRGSENYVTIRPSQLTRGRPGVRPGTPRRGNNAQGRKGESRALGAYLTPQTQTPAEYI